MGAEPDGGGQHSPPAPGTHSLREETDHSKTSKYKYAVSGVATVREESNIVCLGRKHRGESGGLGGLSVQGRWAGRDAQLSGNSAPGTRKGSCKHVWWE